ncbi:MAG TPA: VOC family protein [Solirubrobacterales bacterium]
MPPRQIPAAGETFLDHVGLFLRDLEAAGEKLEELGFRVSPVNVQMARGEGGRLAPVGTSNRNVILPFGFIELLSPTSASELSTRMETAIERYEGTHLIAFSQADLGETERRLTADGWQMESLVKLRRDEPALAWDVLRCTPAQMPEGRIQFALCLTPEAVWNPAAISRPHGVEALSSVLLAVEDPDEAVARFARYVGKPSPPDRAGDLTTLELDRGRLCFVKAEVARSAGIAVADVPQILGIGLTTENPEHRTRVTLGPPLNTVLAIDTPGTDPWSHLVS